ncbi:angiomotin-like 2a [Betta splendens]|uniref:Angiomotin-like 2a n=1 Tax=Betta splendens TaxID=158456 RepID=A0A6P7M629_BETSP|nr:angiomotin-like 2a [Betta splendens]
MRTSEGPSGTVLHRLIQEQLRYGNLTDTRTLLAIQQQALRGGGSGGGPGSPRSSLESLTQEDTQYIHMSARQEPQGQEHQADRLNCESPVCHLYQFHGEELPTYEEAKAHSQYLSFQKGRAEQDIMGSCNEGQWDLKREHARSLSERLLQLSLERNGPRDNPAPMSSSHSFPQLCNDAADPAGADRQGAQQCVDQRGPPPGYPLCSRPTGYMLSHSQAQGQYHRDPPPPFYSQHHRYVSAQSQGSHGNAPAAASRQPAQADALARENERLRKELEMHTEKTARLRKLELEIQRISEAYETLMKGSAKRETLEKTMRNKMEAELKRMHDFNRDLRDQLDAVAKQRAASEHERTDQKQQVFVKLVEQNEEQQREREHLERQVQHLRASGEESQRRRELLEQSLASAQARNRQLEDELQRKRAYVDKVERLQSALAQLQAACEKREALELRLRTRLEQELKSLRAQQSQNQACDPAASEMNSATMQQHMREKEEHILALEADITKWEQKYLEESTMRQFAMDAAATAAAQRDTTIINHSPRNSPGSSFNEDLPLSSHRHQEMENRIRALHAQLLEKDAMIKVLQQRSRWEQGKLEKQGLRPARSVPSINTAAGSVDTKAKSLSDDQTSAAHVAPRGTSRDSSTQSNGAQREPGPRAGPGAGPGVGPQVSEAISVPDASEELKPPLKIFNSVNGSDAEVVEILI